MIVLNTGKPVYKGHLREPEYMPFIILYRLKLCAPFINGKNETILYRQ